MIRYLLLPTLFILWCVPESLADDSTVPDVGQISRMAPKDLQANYEKAERAAAEIAEEIRQIQLRRGRGNDPILEDESGHRERMNRTALSEALRKQVNAAFYARWYLQDAELAEAEARLKKARERHTSRGANSRQIIDRRIAELVTGQDTSWLVRNDPTSSDDKTPDTQQRRADSAVRQNFLQRMKHMEELLDLDVRAAEAALSRAVAVLKKAEEELKADEALKKVGAKLSSDKSAQHEFDIAKANVDAARVELERRHRLLQHQIDLRFGGTRESTPSRSAQPKAKQQNEQAETPPAGKEPETSTAEPDNQDETASNLSIDMIDELEALEINGCRQWVLYRGRDRSRPVVLFVHGGPGYPQMLYSRGLDGPFVEKFVVVHWDQRGSGKSYSEETPPESITLDQIVDDGIQLTAHLKKKFKTDKIILVGHSWGTIVGANMVRKAPDHFRAFVSVGTCADWRRGEELRYADLQQLARQANDQEAIEKLKTLGPPPYRNAERTDQFGELILRLQGFSGSSRKLSEDDLAGAISKTREYSGEEIETALVALRKNMDLLADFGNRYVLMKSVPRLDIPVIFVQGEHDANTPTVLAREYFDVLEAPRGKRWIVFEECAHMAMYEDQQQFITVLESTLDPS